MIRRLSLPMIALIVALGLFGSALAQKKSTMTGYIVDKACSARVSKKDDPQAAAAGHTKNCALMEGCAKSGYGVFVDGKYYEFDEKGTTMAKAALEKSSKEKGAMFKVVGTVSDSKMTVESITEVQ